MGRPGAKIQLEANRANDSHTSGAARGASDGPQAKTVFGFREPMVGVVIDLDQVKQDGRQFCRTAAND